MKQDLRYKILCAVMAIGAAYLTSASPALAADVVVKDGDLYANGNRVTIGGDSDYKDDYYQIIGVGQLNDLDNATDVTGGEVIIDSGKHKIVYGGATFEGSAYKNIVIINGDNETTTSINQVIGGTGTISAYGNTVTINGHTQIISDDAIAGMVIGGHSISGNVYNNNVYINDSVNVKGDVYAGQLYSRGSIYNNNVYISNESTINGNVYGGYSDSGSVTNNKVEINDSATITNNIYGGHAEGSTDINNITTVSGNIVIIGSEENPFEGTIGEAANIDNNYTPTGFIYGGLIGDGDNGSDDNLKTGDVTGNKVYIYGINTNEAPTSNDNYQFNQNIYGGYAEAGNANSNEVTINGGTFGNVVYGGYSEAGSADSNNVNINGGYFKYNVYGGGGKLSASDNNISITGGTFRQLVSGGISFTGSANNNYVDIKNATLHGNITGAVAGTSATGNKVIIDSIKPNTGVNISGATVTNENGTATNNEVIINGGTFTKSEIVAAAAAKEAENNKVIISGGTFTGTTIYAASTHKGTANNNSITITGNANGNNADLSGASLYGYNGATDKENTSNNSLNIDGWSGVVYSVQKFNSLNFTNIDWNRDKDEAILSISTNSDLNEGTSNEGTSVDEISFTGGGHIRPGDKYNLIADKTGFDNNIAPANVTGNYIAGIALEGDGAATTITTTEKGKKVYNLVYTVKSVRTSKQADLVTQSRAVAAAFINQGTDLISDSLDTLSRDDAYGVKTFAAVHGNRSKYDVNSDLKINGWSTIVGVGNAAEFTDGDEFSWGVFYENGSGNYRTYNEFNNEFFRGDGSLVYNGGGIAARYENTNGVYTEGSLRAGMLKSEMDNALRDGSGNYYGYDSESAYYGAHIGVGKIISLSESSDLDVYGKFFHTYTEGDSFTVAKDKFEFDSITSDRLRLGARVTTNKTNAFSTYYGLAYEYEFNGDADMRAQNLAAPTQSLQGSSYMAELGFNYQPTPDSPWNFDLNLRGYAGEREGGSFNVQATYTF